MLEITFCHHAVYFSDWNNKYLGVWHSWSYDQSHKHWSCPIQQRVWDAANSSTPILISILLSLQSKVELAKNNILEEMNKLNQKFAEVKDHEMKNLEVLVISSLKEPKILFKDLNKFFNSFDKTIRYFW